MPSADDQSLSGEPTLAREVRRRHADGSLGDERTRTDASPGERDGTDDGEIVHLEARYRIERTLGQGGMGEVLLATDLRLGRHVAIKRILGGAAGDRQAVDRFLTEAKAIAALNHPHIVQIHDYGRSQDGPFLIMEYVNGGTLVDRCRDGALPLTEAIELACQLCDGLARAHELGIVHRDIKPANVLLTREGVPKLTDFGLAKAPAGDHGRTVTGAVLGTPDFMPPEQRLDAALVDHRSDLWSLAATLYQAVTGRSPRVIWLKDVPGALQDVMSKALEERKDSRFQSAREFQRALRSVPGSVPLGVGVPEDGRCPACSTRNDPARRFCRGCGGALETPCLQCHRDMPAWEDFCGSCGARQGPLLEHRRHLLAADQAKAEALLADLAFKEAGRIAERHLEQADPRLSECSRWAQSFLERVERANASQLGRLNDALATSAAHESAGDYPAAIDCLRAIPDAARSRAVPGFDTVAATLDRLEQAHAENQRLERTIERWRQAGELTGLLPLVERLASRLPRRDDLAALRKELALQEQRILDERDAAARQARENLDRHDYHGAIATLSRVDPDAVDDEVRRLRTAAHDALKRIAELTALLWPELPDKPYERDSLEARLDWADEFLELQPTDLRASALRDELLARRLEVVTERQAVVSNARHLVAEHRYEEAIRRLTGIDPDVECPAIANLRDVAGRKRAAAYDLIGRIKAGIHDMQGWSSAGLIWMIDEYLRLRPNDARALDLRQALVAYTPPAVTIERAGWAAAVLCLAWGGTLAGAYLSGRDLGIGPHTRILALVAACIALATSGALFLSPRKAIASMAEAGPGALIFFGIPFGFADFVLLMSGASHGVLVGGLALGLGPPVVLCSITFHACVNLTGLRDFEARIRSYPDGHPLQTEARMKFRAGQVRDALRLSSQIVEEAPDILDGWIHLAGCHASLGEHSAAVVVLGRAAAFHPHANRTFQYAQAFSYDLARYLARIGDVPSAVRALREAIASDAWCADLARKEPDFDSIRNTEAFTTALAGRAKPGGGGDGVCLS